MNWNPGRPDRVERGVIRLGDGSWPGGRDTQIGQRLYPCLENGANGQIPLQPNAPHAAGAVVGVEVRREFRVLWLQRHRGRITEVVAHVRARSQEPFLFPTP